ncbi:hypothetical protein PWT90_01953 [Aphanocladium album]|nr:hypothetical protein PWT90_01953 [Aphanocladium album]
MMMRLIGGLAATVWLSAFAHAKDFKQQCLQFDPEAVVPHSQLTRLEYLTDGADAEFPDNDPSCLSYKQKVERNLCRVGLKIQTSARSEISFELWLPEQWTGKRLLSTGNGGVDGCIKYNDLAYGSAHGFATLGTNNGHNGKSIRAMLNNDEVVIDYSYRALHTGTSAGKLLTKAFYGSQSAYSYYVGCSLGGRMAIQAADMYPEDYDGIIAGAPAVDFNLLQGERAMFYNITGGKGSPNYVETHTWKGLIHNEVLRQCDGLDGVTDGIIEIPSRCHFDPGALLCPGGCADRPQSECLNGAQVEQLRQIYADYLWPNGTLLFPRMNPGNEIGATANLLAGNPFNYSVLDQEYYRYAVTNDPSWDMSLFSFDTIRAGDDANPGNLRTYPASLARFQSRGGKAIVYHGGQDNQITSFKSELFYERLARNHGGGGGGDLDSWYRFFRISGMLHCSGGPGAWVLGQGGDGAGATPGGFDPDTNVLAAAVAWVEDGRAPETAMGTKYVNDTVSLGVDFQRRHCRYPKAQTDVMEMSRLDRLCTAGEIGMASLGIGWETSQFASSLVKKKHQYDQQVKSSVRSQAPLVRTTDYMDWVDLY